MGEEALSNVGRRAFLKLTGSALASTVVAATTPGMAAAQPAARKPASKTAKKGGTLKVATIGEPPALDPGLRRLPLRRLPPGMPLKDSSPAEPSRSPYPTLPNAMRSTRMGRSLFFTCAGRSLPQRPRATAGCGCFVEASAPWAGRGRMIFGRVDRVEETDRHTVTMTFKKSQPVCCRNSFLRPRP